MSVSIKSEREIKLMKEAGRLLAITHDELSRALKPGMSTWEIDHLGEEIIRSFGCVPNFLHYNGYPASICVSVNDEVVHGIPSKKRIIQEGDIVSLDAGLIYKGYHSDAARTHAIGEVNPEAAKLIQVTRESFFEGIKFAKVLDLEWFEIWSDMASVHICMKILKFLISRQEAEELNFVQE